MSVKTGEGYPEDQEQVSEDESPRGVNISPSSMVDSVADWSLSQVISYLRKKEKDGGRLDKAPFRLHCRSTIKLLLDVIDYLSSNHGVSRNHMCEWLSYHGAALAKDDVVISRLVKAQSVIRSICLRDGDSDTIDIMNSLVPYTPQFMHDSMTHLYLYDSWVASSFEALSRVCGVPKYRVVQIYIVKSILSGDKGELGETWGRMVRESERWDTWMEVRLSAMESLVQRKSK